MSEEKKSGYCKWCHTLTNAIIKVFDNGVMIWTGCIKCYELQKEALKHVTKQI